MVCRISKSPLLLRFPLTVFYKPPETNVFFTIIYCFLSGQFLFIPSASSKDICDNQSVTTVQNNKHHKIPLTDIMIYSHIRSSIT